jgi:hypothetical protein
LVGVTIISSIAVPKSTVIVLVEEPLVIDASEGTDQTYPVAPITASILYIIPVVFSHSLKEPVIEPAASGNAVNEIDVELVVPFPHEKVGVTVTFPDESAKVTVIELLVALLVIVASLGTDHV